MTQQNVTICPKTGADVQNWRKGRPRRRLSSAPLSLSGPDFFRWPTITPAHKTWFPDLLAATSGNSPAIRAANRTDYPALFFLTKHSLEASTLFSKSPDFPWCFLNGSTLAVQNVWSCQVKKCFKLLHQHWNPSVHLPNYFWWCQGANQVCLSRRT